MNLLIETPFFWRTLRARDHVTRARYFPIFFYVAIIVDAYKFLYSLFFGKSFWQFYNTLFAALSFKFICIKFGV